MRNHIAVESKTEDKNGERDEEDDVGNGKSELQVVNDGAVNQGGGLMRNGVIGGGWMVNGHF